MNLFNTFFHWFVCVFLFLNAFNDHQTVSCSTQLSLHTVVLKTGTEACCSMCLPSPFHLKEDFDILRVAVRQTVSGSQWHPEDRKTEQDPLTMVGETDAIA